MAKSVNVLALEAARAEVKRLMEVVRAERETAKEVREQNRRMREFDREARVTARAQLKAKKIAALEAKLLALKNPVGVKASRANRRPSKVTVLKAA
jgi:capsule polysaccharide export protein KpsE/RkpR